MNFQTVQLYRPFLPSSRIFSCFFSFKIHNMVDYESPYCYASFRWLAPVLLFTCFTEALTCLVEILVERPDLRRKVLLPCSAYFFNILYSVEHGIPASTKWEIVDFLKGISLIFIKCNNEFCESLALLLRHFCFPIRTTKAMFKISYIYMLPTKINIVYSMSYQATICRPSLIAICPIIDRVLLCF